MAGSVLEFDLQDDQKHRETLNGESSKKKVMNNYLPMTTQERLNTTNGHNHQDTTNLIFEFNPNNNDFVKVNPQKLTPLNKPVNPLHQATAQFKTIEQNKLYMKRMNMPTIQETQLQSRGPSPVKVETGRSGKTPTKGADFNFDMEEFENSKEIPSLNHFGQIGANESAQNISPRIANSNQKSSIHSNYESQNQIQLQRNSLSMSPHHNMQNNSMHHNSSLNNNGSNPSNNTMVNTSNRSSLLSIRKSEGKSFVSVKADIPRINSLSMKVENVIQTMIETAEDGSVINLPAQHLKLPSLSLRKNITIKGSPGTTLEITDAPILVEGYPHAEKEIRVLFCECTILFDLNKQRFMDNINTRSDSNSRRNLYKEFEDSFKGERKNYLSSVLDMNRSEQAITSRIYNQENYFALFLIKSCSILEARDCQIRSLIKKNLVGTEEAKYLNEIQDICFYINTSVKSNRNPALVLRSTTVNGFSCFVSSDANGTINIQKCHFSESRGHAINLLSPKACKITESVISKAEKSSINIRFCKEAFDERVKNITISENEILQSTSYGVSIYGENMRHQNVNLTIHRNRIVQGSKDALGLKFLNFPCIQITENEFKYNKGNGIFITSVIDTANRSQTLIGDNRLHLNEKNGVLLREASAIMENNDIAQNSISGVNICYGEEMTAEETNFYTKYFVRVILNECKIYGHNDAGLIISGCLKGPIIINSCLINENLSGIVIKEKDWPNTNIVLDGKAKASKTSFLSKNSKTSASILSGRFSQISIEKCEIAKNNNCGIMIRKLYNNLFISESLINANKDYALLLEVNEDKGLVNLKDIERGKLRDYVQGFIGGTWGELYEEKNPACKGNNCNVF